MPMSMPMLISWRPWLSLLDPHHPSSSSTAHTKRDLRFFFSSTPFAHFARGQTFNSKREDRQKKQHEEHGHAVRCRPIWLEHGPLPLSIFDPPTTVLVLAFFVLLRHRSLCSPSPFISHSQIQATLFTSNLYVLIVRVHFM